MVVSLVLDGAAGVPTPVVSCVIIFYNAEPFLDEAIESVFAQHNTEWELILVDDGSTDASSAIARRWVDHSPDRVRLVAHPGGVNRGMSASRNLGIANARGEFVAFLDADDVWLPQKLDAQVTIMRDHPEVAMVCGATVQWFSWSGSEALGTQDGLIQPGEPWLQRTDSPKYGNSVVMPPALALEVYPLGTGTSPSTSSFLFRRELALVVGGYEEQFRGLGEDLIFQTKFFLRYPVFVSTAVWDRYRQHPESSVAQGVKRGVLRDTQRTVLQWIHQYLDARHIDDPAVRAAYARATWAFRHPIQHRLRESLALLVNMAGRVLRKLRRVGVRPRRTASRPPEVAGSPSSMSLGGPPRHHEHTRLSDP